MIRFKNIVLTVILSLPSLSHAVCQVTNDTKEFSNLEEAKTFSQENNSGKIDYMWYWKDRVEGSVKVPVYYVHYSYTLCEEQILCEDCEKGIEVEIK